MSTINPDQWQLLSPYLDQALSMTDEQRAAWLSSLSEQDPSLAERLQLLLDEHRVLAKEGFLERGPGSLSAPTELAGQSIGPYRLVSQVGQGGMGSVWLAKRSDGRFERRVAIKFLSIALVSRGGEERFKREGSILGDSRMRPSQNSWTPACRQPDNRISSWNMSRASTSMATVTNAGWTWKGVSACFLTCSPR